MDSSLNHWANYMYSFGLGHKLGIDVPSEKSGKIPTPELYNKVYGQGHWNFCTIRSLSIGQGEVLVTPLQVANEMAYLANKGWYITPHMVDSIEGGDQFGLLKNFQQKHIGIAIPDSVFEAVHDGMQGVMETGTGSAAKVPGIVVCGKTGTVENYIGLEKQKSHAFFAAFAPRANPKIAIAVICENAGMGANSAAPIASLMIEQYLKDSIPEPDRKAKVEQLANLNLIPPRIARAMKSRDSLMHLKDPDYLVTKALINSIKDTIGISFDEDDDSSIKNKESVTPANPGSKKNNNNKAIKDKPQAIIPEEKKAKQIK
jgi:penicillin-binding protein 2